MDNLNGDVKKLGSAFEAGLIKSGSAANVQLRGNGAGSLRPGQRVRERARLGPGDRLVIAALTAGIGLLGGGILTIVPKVAAARAANGLDGAVGEEPCPVDRQGRSALLALGAVVSCLTSVGAQTDLTVDQLAKLNAALKTNSPKELDKQFEGKGLSFFTAGLGTGIEKSKSMKDALDSMSSSSGKFFGELSKGTDGATFGIFHLSDTTKRFEANFRAMGQGLAEVADSTFKGATKQFSTSSSRRLAAGRTRQETARADARLQGEAHRPRRRAGQVPLRPGALQLAQGKGALATKLMSEAIEEQKRKLAELSGKAQQGTQGHRFSRRRDQELRQGTARRQRCRAAVPAGDRRRVRLGQGEHERTRCCEDQLRPRSEAGRNASSAIDGIASAAKGSAAALFEQSGSQDVATGKLAEGRQALINALGAYGITGQAAEDYANKVMGTPQSWATLFTKNAGQAGAQADDLKNRVPRDPDGKTITMVAGDRRRAGPARRVHRAERRPGDLGPSGARPAGDRCRRCTRRRQGAYASGGAVHGPGTGTSDSIHALLSNGEHVLTASDVARLGGQAAVYGLRQAIQQGKVPVRQRGAVSSAPGTSRRPIGR